MKTNKDYPATHSMATAWYCVDEEGNVGVIDIDDNGPVPVGEYRENSVEDVFWNDFSSQEDEDIKQLHLHPEQIATMLERNEDKGVWDKDGYNHSWSEAIIRIDMSKFDIFKKALLLAKRPYYNSPVCISKNMGLFYVDFFRNQEAVELLEKNDVVLEKYRSVHYFSPDDVDDEDDVESIKSEDQRFPFFIYVQGYSPNYEPAVQLTNPSFPMRIEQLPEEVRNTIKTIPVKFKTTKRIQLAELLPVSSIWSTRYVYDNKIWWELASSDNSLIYYNVSTNRIIRKQEMDELIANGKAEEWNYHKHYNLAEE